MKFYQITDGHICRPIGPILAYLFNSSWALQLAKATWTETKQIFPSVKMFLLQKRFQSMSALCQLNEPHIIDQKKVGWKCCWKRFDSISALAVEWTSHWLEKKSDETSWKCCPKRFYSMSALCIRSWMNHTLIKLKVIWNLMKVVKKGFIVCQPCVSWMNHTLIKRKVRQKYREPMQISSVDFSYSSISWYNCSFHLINYTVISLAGESLMLSVTMAMTTDP